MCAAQFGSAIACKLFRFHEKLLSNCPRDWPPCIALSEADEFELVEYVPVAESGDYVYVCEACGCELTEIPYYNRFYCENCGLHY
jgi:hypothetical protein